MISDETMIQKGAMALAKRAQQIRNEIWEATNRPHLKRDPDVFAARAWPTFSLDSQVVIEAIRAPAEAAKKAEEALAKATSIADGFHREAVSNDEDSVPAWKLYADEAKEHIAAVIQAESDRCFMIAQAAARKAAEDKIRLSVDGRNILSQLAEERQKLAEDIASQIAEGEQP